MSFLLNCVQRQLFFLILVIYPFLEYVRLGSNVYVKSCDTLLCKRTAQEQLNTTTRVKMKYMNKQTITFNWRIYEVCLPLVLMEYGAQQSDASPKAQRLIQKMQKGRTEAP